jgi:hypothetical protein
MAIKQHLEVLQRGVAYWNDWIANQRLRFSSGPNRHSGARIGTSSFWPDFSEADLSGLDLYQGKPGAGWTGIDLIGADLRGARLKGTHLAWANLVGATLYQADLEGATLNSSRFDGASLSEANLTDANIAGCNFLMANLRFAKLTGVHLASTIFSDTDLSEAVGLELCRHGGPSTLDYRTLLTYKPLPSVFLKGCGLPDDFIKYVLASHSDGKRYLSCFISHSTNDVDFVNQFSNDLVLAHVRFWLSAKDLKIGAKMLDSFYTAIGDHDRLIMVCSESSVRSSWVEDEISRAFALERELGQSSIIVPIRIDDAVLTAKAGWAAKLRDSRFIGDFREWRSPEAYRRAFERLLEALQRSAEQ